MPAPTLDQTLADIDKLIEARRTHAEERASERQEEIKLERDKKKKQEEDKTKLRLESEKAQTERRKGKASEEFKMTEEELQQALAVLTERLAMDKETKEEDIKLDEENQLEDVVNNALERGIFRSGIREKNQTEVEERATELLSRAEETFNLEKTAGTERTALLTNQAERRRDLEIQDAMADYEELQAQLKLELEQAQANYDDAATAEIQSIIAQTTDTLALLEQERLDREAAALEREAAVAKEKATLRTEAAPAVGTGAGAGTRTGTATRTTIPVPGVNPDLLATSLSGMKPIVMPTNLMAAPKPRVIPRRPAGFTRTRTSTADTIARI